MSSIPFYPLALAAILSPKGVSATVYAGGCPCVDTSSDVLSSLKEAVPFTGPSCAYFCDEPNMDIGDGWPKSLGVGNIGTENWLEIQQWYYEPRCLSSTGVIYALNDTEVTACLNAIQEVCELAGDSASWSSDYDSC